MKPKGYSRLFISTTAIIAIAFATPSTFADSATWNGTTSATWADASNWTGPPVTAPGTGEIATFDNAGNGNTILDLGTGVTLGSLVFDTASAAAYMIGSGAGGSQTLTLDTTGNAITMNSSVANNQVLNANLALTVTRTAATPSTYYAVSNNSLTNALTLAGGISASTAGVKVLNVTGSGNTAISGAITSGTGNMSLFKTGSGALTLSGGGTFSGTGVTDGSGFASSAVFREGTTILNGGAYNNSNGELVIGGVATHGGVGTNSTLQLANDASLTNMTWLSIGRGNGNGTATSNLTLNGGSSVTSTNLSAGFSAGNALNIPKGTITLNGTSILSVNNIVNFAESAGSNFTMNINDSATFRQTANTQQTKVGMSDGAVGVINVNGGTATFERDFILGAGGTGSGKLVLNSGTANVALGTERWLKLNDSATASTGRIDVDGGNLNLNTNTDIRFSTNASASGTNVINLNAGAITGYTGNNNGVFSGTSVVDLNQGSNQAGVNNTFNLNGGTLTIGQVITTNNSGTAGFNFNGGTLRAAAASTAFLDLGGANQRANVRDGGAVFDTNGFNVTVAQALVHSNIDGDNATDGGLNKLGTGTLTLSNTNTYTGATTVDAGTLVVNGNISTSVLTTVQNTATLSGPGTVGALSILAGGTLAPGNSPGILNTGTIDLQSGATLEIELNSATEGTGYDQLNVTGSATLAGLLSVTLGYTPINDTLFFILLNDGVDAVNGTFSGLANNDILNVGGQDFQISYFGDSATTSFTGGNDVALMAIPEPAAALLGGIGLLALLRRRRN